MKKYILIVLLSSVSSVLFAQWTTPTPPTGITTTNDKIGIGTTSPVSKVEVVGNMGSTPILKLFNTDNVDGRSAILFQSNKPSLQGWEFGENVAGGTNNFGLRDITASGSPIRFVVNTQGYFGIGTNNPTSLLHLASANSIDLKLFSTAAGGYSRLFFGAGTNGTRWNVGQRDDAGGIFCIESDANGSGAWGSRLAISLSGNVGIGTPNPQSILDVKGSPNFKGDVVLYGDVNGGQSNTASPNLIFQGTNYAGATMLTAPLEDTYGRRGFAVYTHSDASDTRNLVERLRISNTGNVGIGTSTPTSKLNIYNSFNGTVSSAIKLFYNGSWGTADYATNFRFIDVSSSEGGSILQVNGYGMGIGFAPPAYSSADKLYVNGNVGIGTANPDEKLTVYGNIHARGVKVDLNGPLADYVFDSDYKLKSLSELNNYLKTNHHLPEIPSAQQAEKEGLDLGKMNQLLLKKVEELTLYIIKQNNKMNQFEKELKQVKRKKIKN